MPSSSCGGDGEGSSARGAPSDGCASRPDPKCSGFNSAVLVKPELCWSCLPSLMLWVGAWASGAGIFWDSRNCLAYPRTAVRAERQKARSSAGSSLASGTSPGSLAIVLGWKSPSGGFVPPCWSPFGPGICTGSWSSPSPCGSSSGCSRMLSLELGPKILNPPPQGDFSPSYQRKIQPQIIFLNLFSPL